MKNSDSLSAWEANAEFWDNYMGDDSNFFHCDIVRPKTDELLKITSDDFVLDIACGNGNYSACIASKGGRVVGFDYSHKMIELAIKRRSNFLDMIDFQVCDATDYNALLRLKQDKPFTKAVANMAIMDISNIDPLFKAVYDMIEEGGVFVFSIHHPCFTYPNSDYLTPDFHKDIAIEGQPELQYYFHRSIEDILNLSFKYGFSIDGFYEIPLSGDKVPIIMIIRLRK